MSVLFFKGLEDPTCGQDCADYHKTDISRLDANMRQIPVTPIIYSRNTTLLGPKERKLRAPKDAYRVHNIGQVNLKQRPSTLVEVAGACGWDAPGVLDVPSGQALSPARRTSPHV